MKKVQSPLGFFYWVSPDRQPSPDGLPVYTHAEIALIKKHKDTLPPDLLLKLNEMKRAFGVDLAQLDMNLAPPQAIEPEAAPSPGKALAVRYAGETLEMLRRAKRS